MRNCSLWQISPSDIHFVSDEAPRTLRYFDFATRQIRTIFEVDTDFSVGLSVSLQTADGYFIHKLAMQTSTSCLSNTLTNDDFCRHNPSENAEISFEIWSG